MEEKTTEWLNVIIQVKKKIDTPENAKEKRYLIKVIKISKCQEIVGRTTFILETQKTLKILDCWITRAKTKVEKNRGKILEIHTDPGERIIRPESTEERINRIKQIKELIDHIETGLNEGYIPYKGLKRLEELGFDVKVFDEKIKEALKKEKQTKIREILTNLRYEDPKSRTAREMIKKLRELGFCEKKIKAIEEGNFFIEVTQRLSR